MKRRNDKENSWSGKGKVNKKRKRVTEIEVEGKKKIMSVVFVPHTYKSELAKRLRERLEKLEKLGSLKLKVVEKTGEKLVDLLHRSDSWSDMDCNREDCLICGSAGEKEKKGKCKRRNVVYETYCITCAEKEEKERNEKEKEIEKEAEREVNVEKENKNKKKRKREEDNANKDKEKRDRKIRL